MARFSNNDRDKYVRLENPLEQTFKIASLPSSALKKCMADSSLLTEIIIQKYLYHLPFHRIIQKFRDSGFIISNSTIGDWFAATCVKIRPLYDKLKEDILTSDYIQVDETTLPVISDEKNRAVKGYVWVVRNAVDGDVFFHYANGSRSQSTAKALLGEFRGAIQSDGYNAYDQFDKMPGKITLGCMAHARRKFTEGLDENRKIATEALVFFSKLYEIEKEIRENSLLDYTQIKQIRQEKSYPILIMFEKWMVDNYSKVLDSSRIGRAINYTYSLLPKLSRYVLNGKYNIDNNLIENTIRPLCIGRKNFLLSKAFDNKNYPKYPIIQSGDNIMPIIQ